jgi:hypothetical protein
MHLVLFLTFRYKHHLKHINSGLIDFYQNREGLCISRMRFLKLILVSHFVSLHQRCTRFLHACSALCKCANRLCRTCTPHHTVSGISSVSLTQSPFAFPSNCRCDPPLTSYMPGRAVPSRARVHGTAAHFIARCARLVHLCTTLTSL